MTLLDAMLALGVLVVVPLGVPLHPHAPRGSDRWLLAAGALAAAAVVAPRGPVAGLLAVPWLALAAVGGIVVLRAAWPRRREPLAQVPWLAAAAYLAVGAAWLLADRLDLAPVGFTEPFVQLTAIHFHYAGAVSSLLAGVTLRARPGDRVALVASTLTAGSPPVVALGFTLAPPLLVLGAVALTAGLWGVAWVLLRHVAPRWSGPPRVLLTVAALSVLAGMVLAVQWALGAVVGTPALSIPVMARTHGVLNGIGFALLGTVAWRLQAAPAAVGPPA